VADGSDVLWLGLPARVARKPAFLFGALGFEGGGVGDNRVDHFHPLQVLADGLGIIALDLALNLPSRRF
jgi:hypothetical protein